VAQHFAVVDYATWLNKAYVKSVKFVPLDMYDHELDNFHFTQYITADDDRSFNAQEIEDGLLLVNDDKLCVNVSVRRFFNSSVIDELQNFKKLTTLAIHCRFQGAGSDCQQTLFNVICNMDTLYDLTLSNVYIPENVSSFPNSLKRLNIQFNIQTKLLNTFTPLHKIEKIRLTLSTENNFGFIYPFLKMAENSEVLSDVHIESPFKKDTYTFITRYNLPESITNLTLLVSNDFFLINALRDMPALKLSYIHVNNCYNDSISTVQYIYEKCRSIKHIHLHEIHLTAKVATTLSTFKKLQVFQFDKGKITANPLNRCPEVVVLVDRANLRVKQGFDEKKDSIVITHGLLNNPDVTNLMVM
jgi:hypothetical protein